MVKGALNKSSKLVIQNSPICYALECNKIATESIKVNAGNFGIIRLKVCKKCSKLFNIDKENKNHSAYTGSPAVVSSE